MRMKIDAAAQSQAEQQKQQLQKKVKEVTQRLLAGFVLDTIPFGQRLLHYYVAIDADQGDMAGAFGQGYHIATDQRSSILELIDTFILEPADDPIFGRIVPDNFICKATGGEVSYNGCARIWYEWTATSFFSGYAPEKRMVDLSWPHHFVPMTDHYGFMRAGPPTPLFEGMHPSGWPVEFIQAVRLRSLGKTTTVETVATMASAETMLRIDRTSTIGNTRMCIASDLYYRLHYERAQDQIRDAINVEITNTLERHAEKDDLKLEVLRSGFQRDGIPWLDKLRLRVQMVCTYLKRHPVLMGSMGAISTTVLGMGFTAQAAASLASASLLSPVLMENFVRLLGRVGTRYLPEGFLNSLRDWSGRVTNVLEEFWNWLKTAITSFLGLPESEVHLGHVLWVLVLLPLFHVSWLTISGTLSGHLFHAFSARDQHPSPRLGQISGAGSQPTSVGSSHACVKSGESPLGSTSSANKSQEKLERKTLQPTVTLLRVGLPGKEPSTSKPLLSERTSQEPAIVECLAGEMKKFGTQKIPTPASSWQCLHTSELRLDPSLYHVNTNWPTISGLDTGRYSSHLEPLEKSWGSGYQSIIGAAGRLREWIKASLTDTIQNNPIQRFAPFTKSGESRNSLTGLCVTCTGDAVDPPLMD